MNHLIVKRLLGREASVEEAPVILDTYANTSSAGSVIAFHTYQDDLPSGALAILSSFGAGYSIGSVICASVDPLRVSSRAQAANNQAFVACASHFNRCETQWQTLNY